MSMVSVRNYFESVGKDLGYKVSEDAFEDKLPAQSGKRLFIHIGKASVSQIDQASAHFKSQVTLKIFVGKSLNTSDMETKTYQATEEFLIQAVQSAPTAQFQMLSFSGYDVERLAQSNDSVMIGVIEFEAEFVLGFRP